MTVTLVGAAASLLLVLNVAPRASIAVAGLCFLSFVAAAQDFSSYQSDGMLLEAAVISLFVAPRALRPGLGALLGRGWHPGRGLTGWNLVRRRRDQGDGTDLICPSP